VVFLFHVTEMFDEFCTFKFISLFIVWSRS